MKKLSIFAKSLLMCSLITVLATGCFGKKAEQPAPEAPQPTQNIQQPEAPAANEMGTPVAAPEQAAPPAGTKAPATP